MKAMLFFLLSSALPLQAQERLLSAEQAIEQGAALAQYDHFRGHPLYPYLEYRAYRKQVDQGFLTDDLAVSTFLKEHPDAPYSGWLAEHAFPLWLKQGNYNAIINAWHPHLADESIECEYRLAQLANGNTQQAYNGLDSLWLSAKSIDAACDPLFARAKSSGALNNEKIKERFFLATRANNNALATYLANELSGSEGTAAQQWMRAANSDSANAALAINNPFWQQSALAYILSRDAFKSTASAANMAFTHIQSRVGDAELEAQLFNRLTRALAQIDDPRAIKAWQSIPSGSHDDNTFYDLLAYFLRQHDWSSIKQTFNNNLSPTLANKAEVQYWLGKASERLGQDAQSRAHYQKAATQRDFFGFLAAEKLGQPYAFNDRSIAANPTVRARVMAKPEAWRMLSFARMGLDNRALNEWQGLLKGLNEQERQQAAMVASDLNWHIQAIVTLADLKYWDALSTRFPLEYETKIRALATQHNLSPATIYAIIRKESIFQPTIKSPAGALGLMQVMPATARDTARRYGISYSGSQSLMDVNTNLTIGTQYLSDRLNEFGHLAYAAAAYNAGPHRARRWLSGHPGLPLDEWIAQIPFVETRDYVKRVLEYEKVYQYRLAIPYTTYSSARVQAW
ncbi:transglycosylase SLT domain-containing protein [Suttonella sp. R2A3]|uniref:transglycosylase SLT domain-containing protein n=1 Tax=Suttonella sp. R2A3 TaxID=2908648 RepID=UPI001F277EC2|nr:transglycosylase SLT domain-containing protein [Suttonella sp. R2A3]UJF24706.1 transglycosylase SLT domain-containing protein [Suttonella sp. R2A3]